MSQQPQQRIAQLEAQLRSMTLAFKRTYADNNPSHSEPSQSYVTSILSGTKDKSNEIALQKAEKRKLKLQAEILAMQDIGPTKVLNKESDNE